MKTSFDKFNENKQYGIKIWNYVDANDFAEYIAFEFNIDKSEVYHRLLENDYIEGSLGSRWELEGIKDDVEDEEIANWYESFLINYELENITLKY